MGLYSLSGLDRFLVYSGFSLYRFLVYSGFSLDRFLVYSGFSLGRFLVYSGSSLGRFLVYSGYTSLRTGFELTRLVVIGTDCTVSSKSNYHDHDGPYIESKSPLTIP
jgi:hypothetical protein